MRRYSSAAHLSVIAAGLLLAVTAGAARAQQFSGEIAATGPDAAKMGPPQRIMYSNGKMHMESSSGVLLLDGKAQTAYVLLPDQSLYLEQPQMLGMLKVFVVDNPDDPCPQWKAVADQSGQSTGTWACAKIGNETVNGRTVVKYQGTSPNGQQGFVWVDPKLKFMVKSQDASGKGMELRNVKEGPQAATLFEVPSTFKKGDMQQLQQQQQQQGGKPKVPPPQ